MLFDGKWDVLIWEVDPPIARCPYIETLSSRNLEILVERIPEAKFSQEDAVQESKKLIQRIEKEDWFTRPDVVDKKIEFNGKIWPAHNTRASHILTPDLTKEGTLYALWRSICLDPREDNVRMMIQYLEFVQQEHPFEELFYYKNLHARLTNQPENSFLPKEKKGLNRVLAKLITPGLRRTIKKLYYG